MDTKDVTAEICRRKLAMDLYEYSVKVGYSCPWIPLRKPLWMRCLLVSLRLLSRLLSRGRRKTSRLCSLVRVLGCVRRIGADMALDPLTTEIFRKFVEGRRWKFSVKYADFAPHYYTVKDWKGKWLELLEFIVAVKIVYGCGYKRRWRGQ